MYYFIADNGGPTQSTTSQNGPLRGFKMTTYEGGPRLPFLMQWKGTLPAGRVEDRPAMNLDVLPTCVAAAGGKIEASWKLDGVDLMPYLAGGKTERPHETMYWRFGKQWAVRHGDWKLVVANGGSGKPELYNLASDVSESKDLATAEPAKVAELQKLFDAWNAEQAEPSVADNPGKNSKKAATRKAAKKPAKA